jgi:hypothetical protein
MNRAIIYIGLAAAAIAAGGGFLARTMHLPYGHAVYCAIGTAATVGCDAAPADGGARLASSAVIVVCVPLFALAYGSLSSAHLRKHMGLHMRATVKQVKDELASSVTEMQKHVTASADALHRRLNDHAELIRAQQQAAGDQGASVAASIQDLHQHISAMTGPVATAAAAAARTAAADGPVSEGAGGDPARSEGLPADGPVVPPSAAASTSTTGKTLRRSSQAKGM